MLLSVPQKASPAGLTGGGVGRALCIQIEVMASPPSSPPPVLFGTLYHLVQPECSSEKKIAPISCSQWHVVSRLWTGPGRWEGGLEPTEPQTLRCKSKLGGWVPEARTRTQYSSLQQPGSPPQVRNSPHLSKYQVVCMQVFFHNGPTARVSATHMQMSFPAGLMEWRVWMANKTLFPRNASVYRVSVATFPHAADLGKQTYLLIGAAMKDIHRKVTLQGSS